MEFQDVRKVTPLHRVSRWALLLVCLFGTRSFAGYSPYPDTSILTSIETGAKYFIAGGAKFQIQPSEYTAYTFNFLRYTVSQSVIDSITDIPYENTLLRERTGSAVYLVMGGRKWHVPTPEELEHWGGASAVDLVPTGSLSYSKFEFAIGNLLVRERTGGQVYVMIQGSRFAVNTPAELNYYGGEGSVRPVPVGSLYDAYLGPQCGQVLAEFSGTTVYELGWASNPANGLRKKAVSVTSWGVVPDGALASIPVASVVTACIH